MKKMKKSLGCPLPKQCKVDLRLSRLEKELDVSIANVLSAMENVFGPTLLLDEFPVVLQ